MRKRWRVVVLIIIGVLAFVLGGFLLVLRLTSPPVLAAPISAEPKALPEAWLEPGSTQLEDEAVPPALQTSSVASPPSEARWIPFSTSGTLALVGKDRPFGEESYELDVREDGITLVSNGRFWFKVVIATINVTFEQRYETDSSLRPRLYEAAFDAPLGQDRSIRSEVIDGVAHITSDDEREEIPIDDDTFVLGMFSTYALLPVLFPLWESDGLASFDVLMFGGPPQQDEMEGGVLPRMSIERLSSMRIRAESLTLSVDAYAITSDFGDSLLLARDNELLAVLAGGDEESLLVYRTDYFPDGFEIVDDAAGSSAPPASSVP